MFIEILGLSGLLIFLFVGLHECELFNLVNFQALLLCGLEPKLQSPMVLIPHLQATPNFVEMRSYL